MRAYKLRKVCIGDTGIYTHRNPDTVRGADVLFISNERYAQVTSSSYLDVAPDLVVEILSPSNTWRELEEKVQKYFAIGVRMMWVINMRQRCVHIYRAPGDVFEVCEHEQLSGAHVLPGFAIEVGMLFVT